MQKIDDIISKQKFYSDYVKFIGNTDNTVNYSKELLGNRGLSLIKMSNFKIPIPMGFILTTEVYKNYCENNFVLNKKIENYICKSILRLENLTNKKFCYNDVSMNESKKFPLLLSVQVGSKDSIPCMPDTLLNVGINELAVRKLIKQGAKKDVVCSKYLEFIKNYSTVIEKIDRSEFENILGTFEEKIVGYKRIYKQKTGDEFPENPKKQLAEIIKFIFECWNSPRATRYRELQNMDKTVGVSVIVQSMVDDNYMNTGKIIKGSVFTRHPITGKKCLFGDISMDIQSDVYSEVAFTLMPIEQFSKLNLKSYKKLEKVVKKIEMAFGNMQYVEFIILNEGDIYITKSCDGKRSARASVKIALDLIDENKLSKKDVLSKLSLHEIESLLYSFFKPEYLKNALKITKGVGLVKGIAAGRVVFSTKAAEIYNEKCQNTILVKNEMSAEGISSMNFVSGILTISGGATSHSAVIARGMGKPWVSGCEKINISEKSFSVGKFIINEGDFISIDGSTGNIYFDKLEMTTFTFSEDISKFLDIADSQSNLKVYANADNAKDVLKSINLGAKGIGLCRTEHMFFESERIKLMQQMILASSETQRHDKLEKLLLFQEKDFKEMFKILKDKPLTVRLIDPPLHEFLPRLKSEIVSLSKNLNDSVENIEKTIEKLKESNPMMGHRGCRLLISYPEIIEIQTKAIISAALTVQEDHNCTITPKIMIPFVGDVKEIKFIKKIINQVADNMIKDASMKYKIGAMIEIPRAAILADEIASEVDFLSFGTNDLTQLTLGISRDDSHNFLNHYIENNICKFDPFFTLDQAGVGALIKMAMTLSKKVNPNLEIGVCGEHAGDHESIIFFKNLGFDYISCSPFKIPLSRFSVSI